MLTNFCVATIEIYKLYRLNARNRYIIRDVLARTGSKQWVSSSNTWIKQLKSIETEGQLYIQRIKAQDESVKDNLTIWWM